MEEEKLKQVKWEIQAILNRHLEPEHRFSIQDLDEESVFLLIDLLLEKNDLERERIRAKIQKKIKDSQFYLDSTYNSILEVQDKLNFQKNKVNDLDDLKELIHTEDDLDKNLKEI